MTGFTSMAERHAFGLDALAEMTGKLLQTTYLRASRVGDPEDQDRAILLFDRLARGFRLTVALEARMDRDRRRDAAGITAESPAAEAVPGLPPPVSVQRPARPPREGDEERDVDLEPADLPGQIRDLRRMVVEDADILDPDGTHAETLDRWTASEGGADADAGLKSSSQRAVHTTDREPGPPSLRLPPRRPPNAEAPRRASG